MKFSHAHKESGKMKIGKVVQATSLDQKVESRVLVCRLCQRALGDFQVKVG